MHTHEAEWLQHIRASHLAVLGYVASYEGKASVPQEIRIPLLHLHSHSHTTVVGGRCPLPTCLLLLVCVSVPPLVTPLLVTLHQAWVETGSFPGLAHLHQGTKLRKSDHEKKLMGRVHQDVPNAPSLLW